MYIIALIQLPLEIGQSNHDGQVVPDIARFKLQRFAHETRSPNTGAWCFSTFDAEDSLALKIIEILGETSAIGLEVMPLHGQHQQCIDLIEGI